MIYIGWSASLSLNKNEWDGFCVKWYTNGMHKSDDFAFACVCEYLLCIMRFAFTTASTKTMIACLGHNHANQKL